MRIPNYSVIIPVYNGASTIADTIASALAQSVKPFEIIVIDDCSTDNTWQVVSTIAASSPAVCLYQNPTNQGVAATRNAGVSFARAPYVAFLDADDLWHPEKMQTQLAFMESSGCDISCTGYDFISASGQSLNKVYHVPAKITIPMMLRENYVGCSTAVIKTEVAQAFEMCSDYLHEDYVYWLMLLKHHKTLCGIDRPLMHYRVGAGGRSSNKQRAAKERWKIYRGELHLSLPKAAYYFCCYAWRGLRKHKNLG